MFFTSSGNRADSHYQGTFNGNGDDWHDFSAGDETIDLTISTGSGGAGNYYLCWSNSSTDFDFYLYNNAMTQVASSTNSGGTFEEFYFENTTGSTGTYHLAVLYRSGSTAGVQIEIFSHNAGTWNEHTVAAGSTTSPSNATNTGVVSVGAVAHGSYSQPNGSDVIKSYSSRGPSNSGMTLPDLCGPTDTTGYIYPGGFGGTSAATPNAAGAACAFWSADSGLSNYAIRWLMREQADLSRDWGASGDDNVYGKGGAILADYHYGTEWLARSYGNSDDSTDAPYYTFQAAHDAIPSGGRMLVFAGSYPETALLGDTGKSMTIELVPDSSSATMGD